MYKKSSLLFLNVSLILLLMTMPAFGQKSLTNARRRIKTHRPRTPTSKSQFKSDFTKLVERLRAQGAAVKYETEKVSQPFFSVKGRVLLVEDEAVQVFEYGTPATAENEARRVNPTGTVIGTSSVSWMAPPHFYRKGKLILIYVGNNARVTGLLEEILGPQFAGG